MVDTKLGENLLNLKSQVKIGDPVAPEIKVLQGRFLNLC